MHKVMFEVLWFFVCFAALAPQVGFSALCSGWRSIPGSTFDYVYRSTPGHTGWNMSTCVDKLKEPNTTFAGVRDNYVAQYFTTTWTWQWFGLCYDSAKQEVWVNGTTTPLSPPNCAQTSPAVNSYFFGSCTSGRFSICELPRTLLSIFVFVF
jgi:hypothetical protein